MRFPKVVRNKKTKAEVTIYGKKPAYPFYRICWRVAGKRMMKSVATYSEARKQADALVDDLGKGSTVSALSPARARDALAAFERLQAYFEATGRRVSLLACASEYCEAAAKVPGTTIGEAVDGFLVGVATVKRMDLKDAVEKFIADRKLKTVAKEGKRPQLSPEHFANTNYWLRQFAGTFPGNAVCDLTKSHMNLHLAKYSKLAPKSRNERRSVLKMLLQWCVEQDFLARTHRLFEATSLKHEPADPEEIDYYRPEELRVMLERASQRPPIPKEGHTPEPDYRGLLPILALAGLAGMREKEILRLSWEEVFAKPGQLEVKALKSKTRSRRLVQICPALAQWLEPYRRRTGAVWSLSYDMFHIEFAKLRQTVKAPNRRNGLRHAWVSYHYALHADEGLTAMQAGNSPGLLHKNYKGLVTKSDAEEWFAVAPEKAANGQEH